MLLYNLIMFVIWFSIVYGTIYLPGISQQWRKPDIIDWPALWLRSASRILCWQSMLGLLKKPFPCGAPIKCSPVCQPFIKLQNSLKLIRGTYWFPGPGLPVRLPQNSPGQQKKRKKERKNNQQLLFMHFPGAIPNILSNASYFFGNRMVDQTVFTLPLSVHTTEQRIWILKSLLPSPSCDLLSNRSMIQLWNSA